MNKVALSIRGLVSGYGASNVLHGLSLELARGRIAAILGRNGVGKTTLIMTLAGHIKAKQGSVAAGEVDITNLPAHVITRHSIGLVPQGRRLFPSLTVEEHLILGIRPRRDGVPGWTVQRVLNVFPRLVERLGNMGTKLSGGEQTMVACGRALLGNPDILLMDEPSEGLAPILVTELGIVLRQLRDEGVSILLVEQNLSFAQKIADDIHIMSKGQIVHSSSPDDLRADPEIRSRYLGI